jgi:hypothetical protein
MSQEDTISLKEFINMKFSEFSEKIKNIGDVSSRGLEKITLIDERVDNHEQKLQHIIDVLDSHNTMLVMDEGKTKQRDMLWKICMWATPFFLAGLGYFGFLYVEHIKTEIVAQTSNQIDILVTDLKKDISRETSEQVITLIEKNYNPSIK